MKYFGKYRGKVISTEDLTVSGKLLCEVPALPGMLLNWATPCTPYASFEQGFFAVPEEGSDVWIEFERGDPDKPIWCGGFWEPGAEPVMPELSPELPELINVLRSKFCTLTMNDTPGDGGVTLSVIGIAEPPVLLTMTAAGFSVIVGELTLEMNAETGIVLTAGESVLALTPEGLNIETPVVGVEAEGGVNVAGATSIEGEEINLTGPVTVEGETNITGAVTIEGETNVTGSFDVEGESNFAGAVTVEGETNVAGALTIEGETNVAGMLSVEGDANFLGAQQTEGNNAVAGLIEGVVVPPLL